MARTYGAVYLDIWRDKDFLALPHTEKYMYWALIFQPKLNRAGLLDYMPDRWADDSGDMTTAEIEVAIKGLAAKRYVVLDASTHELLIRTYVRNSEVWRMPKAFASVIPAAKEIRSSRLRHVLLADLDKIRLGELSEAPGANGAASIRAKIDAYLVTLRSVLDDGEPDDPAGLDESEPDDPQSYGPRAERVSVPNEYGTDTGLVPSGTRVHAQAVPLPLQVPVPVQVPTPSALASVTRLPLPVEPEPQQDDGALFGFEGAAGKPQPNAGDTKPKASRPKKADKPAESSRGTRIPADFDITESMRRWGEKNAPHVNGRLATDEFVDYWMSLPGSKALKLDWVRTWQNRMRELESRALERIERAQVRSAAIPAQRPSATTQRTRTGVDLIQQFAAEEGVDLSTAMPSNVIPIRREISA